MAGPEQETVGAITIAAPEQAPGPIVRTIMTTETVSADGSGLVEMKDGGRIVFAIGIRQGSRPIVFSNAVDCANLTEVLQAQEGDYVYGRVRICGLGKLKEFELSGTPSKNIVHQTVRLRRLVAAIDLEVLPDILIFRRRDEQEEQASLKYIYHPGEKRLERVRAE